MSDKSHVRTPVFLFETQDQAWAFIGVASAGGYTEFDAVSPFGHVDESCGAGTAVPIPNEYLKFLPDLKRISRSVKPTRGPLSEGTAISFDKFMDDPRLSCELPVHPADDVHPDGPMRARAARHQELPQNRIRMTSHV